MTPASVFAGILRPYQVEGVSWLASLEKTRAGGVLADDMGLGKTVQILAYIAALLARTRLDDPKPTLIVMPKSLLHNWAAEAAKFTPGLRVLVYAGTRRESLLREIRHHDLVLISYAGLRQDAEKLRPQEFRLLIADEAQNIKNPKAQVSLACREIQAERRIAVTGTPIENSLGDLFALLEFACPGRIDADNRRRVEAAVATRSLENGTVQTFAQVLSPFVLRRTKAQVLSDLPPKTEAHLYCDLSPREFKDYEELRVDYRSRLFAQIKKNGLGSAKIIVLEALLRLRQISCHPGLVYKERKDEDSTKLEVLLAQLEELAAEGHRALVFSQFTSFLDIVEAALKRRGLAYVRMDGSSTDLERQEAVQRFQAPGSGSMVFLASLKAGGTGLNLTAAEYVYILDPWWNPATENQAIDRAHRIGQKNKVIAYRMIAKGTIEEKILALQQSKRELAHAVVGGEESLIASLTLGDLESLFA
jgi:SNF2 family DNA or RNA helicase